MIDFIYNFHFLRPWVLLFLIIPVFLRMKKIKIKGAISSWENICDKNLFEYLAVKNKKFKRKSFTKYIYIGLISAILAAAGPAWKKVEIPSFIIENPTIFVLSLSPDMEVEDVRPSRLERAKFFISDILDASEQGQFGLVAYSDEPFNITPITDDAKLIKSILPQVSTDIMPGSGDRLDRAIEFAKNRLKQSGFSDGNIIVLASDIVERFDEALKKASRRGFEKYNIHVIDFSYHGNEKLKLVADKGNGAYLLANDNDVAILTDRIKITNDEKTRASKNFRSNYLDYGYYLLAIPMFCLLMFFRKGVLILFFVLFAQNAYAGFFTNSNQDALKLFNNNEFEKALSLFRDKNWKSVTLYKLDRLEEALKEIENEKSELSIYNKGVILTRLCKYDEAKKMFDQVIKLNPNNGDAKYNMEKLNELFLKAKDDPSVLECDNQQQNNKNNQDNNQNNDKNNEDKNNQNNQDKNSDNNDKQNNENKEENQQEQNNNDNQDQNSDKNNQNQDKQNDDDNDNQNNNQQQKEENQLNSNDEKNKESPIDDENKNNQKQDKQNSASNEKKENNKNNENSKQKAPMDNENGEGEEQNSDDKNEENNNDGNNEKEQQQQLERIGAKTGDKDEEYDEKALMMERKYREIPEDIGGLLREFIKKEHMKDRYKNEGF